MTLRIVVDTNILISALTSRRDAAPRRIYKAILNAEVTLILSIPAIAELEDVLNRPYVAKYHGLNPNEVSQVIDQLAQASEFVAGYIIATASPDPNDNIFLAAAVEGQANYIVSGDKKHLLSLGEYQGIRILTATQFVSEALNAKE
jgi:putative PIN family toxin of toxin-antitoxin system